MEPLFFVMAIMGCGDGSTACEPARTMPARYATMAQCRAELPQALAQNTDLSYPVITGDCRASGMQVAAKAKATRGS